MPPTLQKFKPVHDKRSWDKVLLESDLWLIFDRVPNKSRLDERLCNESSVRAYKTQDFTKGHDTQVLIKIIYCEFRNPSNLYNSDI